MLTNNALRPAKVPKFNQTKSENKILLEIKQQKDILILPADKGIMTVAMSKDDYTNKAQDLHKKDHTQGLYE